eukprot:366436-Chlamydomonas_euryale.AAC.13
MPSLSTTLRWCNGSQVMMWCASRVGPCDEYMHGDDADRPLGLLYEERLERAEKRRLQGNELFAQGMHKEALGKYAAVRFSICKTQALSYMDEDFLMQCEGFYLDKAHEVKMPVHLNMAACQLQLGDFNTAIYNCGEVRTACMPALSRERVGDFHDSGCEGLSENADLLKWALSFLTCMLSWHCSQMFIIACLHPNTVHTVSTTGSEP